LPILLVADSLESAFKNGGTTGSINLYHYTIDKQIEAKDAYATAIGGDLTYTTNNKKSFFASVGFHNSTPSFKSKNKDSTSLFSSENNAEELTVLSESFLAYNKGNSMLKVGNFLLDTPLINKTSARIIPWSFQGASLLLTNVFKSSLQLNYVTKMRENRSTKYTKQGATGDIGDGIAMIGFKHHPISPLDVHLYYYYAPSLYDSSFAQIDYKDNVINDSFLFCVGFQNIKTYDDRDANLLGLRTGIFTDTIDITLNYSKNSGSEKADAYGGFSKVYTASMISNGRGADATTWMLKTNFELALIKKQSSEFSVWLANLESDSSQHNSYYTHFRHNIDTSTKIFIRYEYRDFKDESLDTQYFRFITSYDF
jgi:hypothetical protein